MVCGPTQRAPDKKTNVTNPKVVVEITSDGTEDYDRGEKLSHYQQISTLEAVVSVSHREPKIDVWSRAAGSLVWSRLVADAGQVAAVAALGCELDVDAIWRAAAETG